MRKFIAAILVLLPMPAFAQDEIIVTASRQSADNEDYVSAAAPAVGLRRAADFAILSVQVTSDTRDEDGRVAEIFAMVKGAIDAAGAKGVELATGDFVVEPLTSVNYRNLPTQPAGRPDTSKVEFLLKTRLSGTDGKAAIQRINDFIKSVKPVGRAEIIATGSLTLSLVDPAQYRDRVLELIAADARTSAGRFGTDYRVEVSGLEGQVQWARASLTEVFLYIPYNYRIVSAGDR